MNFFDAHLDMAMNAIDYERDQSLPVSALRQREQGGVKDDRGTATVSIHELKQGGCGVVLSTVIARSKPWVSAGRAIARDNIDWPDPSMAYAAAMGQLAYYRLLEGRGHLRLITSAEQLHQHTADWNANPENTPLGLILTMEGADPITEPDQLYHWHAAGLRTLMLAHFGKSHYAHGTPHPKPDNAYDIDGPLTDMGRAILPMMHQIGMPLDLTHTADRSFAEAADLFPGRIYSSHTACRAICNIPRNHSDAQIKTLLDRGGVIGLPLYNRFLSISYADNPTKGAVTYATVADHVDHICQLAGNAKHVGIGSDADGGFGREHMPAELDTHRDIYHLGQTLTSRGYSEADIAGIMKDNWLRFFGQTLG